MTLKKHRLVDDLASVDIEYADLGFGSFELPGSSNVYHAVWWKPPQGVRTYDRTEERQPSRTYGHPE